VSDLSNLLLLLVLGAIVGLWLKLSVGRERAVQEARRQCLQHGLQLLDETVGLRGVRLRRVNGLRMIERCYGFEVSIDGHDREPGRLWMICQPSSCCRTRKRLPAQHCPRHQTATSCHCVHARTIGCTEHRVFHSTR
jgi:hypothetical protein